MWFAARGLVASSSLFALATTNTNAPRGGSSSSGGVGVCQMMMKKNAQDIFIRPFDSNKDNEQLQYICRNVYGGTDYLPSQAIELENDLTCNFQVLVTKGSGENEKQNGGSLPPSPPNSLSTEQDNVENETLLAVANVRSLDEKTGWLEAVRTNEEYRGQGLATYLINDIFQKTLQPSSSSSLSEKKKACNYYDRVMSMTIDSNLAMQRVFQRLGMTKTNSLRISDFTATSKLPGYADRSNDDKDVHYPDSVAPCQNLLDALNITNLIPEEAKKTADLWQPVTSVSSLQRHLDDVTSSGMMPGAWKVMSPETTPCLQESIKEGLVFVIREKLSSCSSSADEDHHHHHHPAQAVMALVKDAKSVMPTIKSPWILCLAASTESHLYSALWHACFSDDVQSKLKRGITKDEEASTNREDDGASEDSNNTIEESKSDEAGFVVVFDNDIQINDDISGKLLLRDERPIVYSINL